MNWAGIVLGLVVGIIMTLLLVKGILAWSTVLLVGLGIVVGAIVCLLYFMWSFKDFMG